MPKPTDERTVYPVLKPRPTLIQALAMEQGRLAKWTFGKPTDCVFTTVEVQRTEKGEQA